MNVSMLHLGQNSSWSASGWTLVPNVTPGGEGLKKDEALEIVDIRQQDNVSCSTWCAGWLELEP